MFDQFVDLQDRILNVTVRAEAALTSAGERDVAALGQTRWELARALREYQLFKHGMIFDRLIGRGDYRAIEAARMKAQCIRLGDEFRAYVLKWSVVSILDHWGEYQPAALAAIARIRAHLAKERTGVMQLLEERAA